jgi:hypothetical protein
MRYQNRPLDNYLVISTFEYNNNNPNIRRELLLDKLYIKLKEVEDGIEALNYNLENNLNLLIKLYKSGSSLRSKIELRQNSDNIQLEIIQMFERKENILKCIKILY